MAIHHFTDSALACEKGTVHHTWAERGGAADVKFGDTLVIESEAVVAVATMYPFAVTMEQGDFYRFTWDEPVSDPAILLSLAQGIRAAVEEAQRRGFTVNPAYSGFHGFASSNA
jgi:hypothetical protein